MAGCAVIALATLFCIQSSQVAPSPNIHLVVFIVACISPLHLHLYHSCGMLGRKAVVSLLVIIHLYESVPSSLEKAQVGYQELCVLVAEGLTLAVCH